MRKVLPVIFATIVLFGLVACVGPVQADVLRSSKPRVTSPAVDPTDVISLVAGNSDFAFGLYRALKDTDSNIFYSPSSISEALAMTYGGARGETEKQMAAALQFKLSQDKLHAAFDSLDLALSKRGQSAEGQDEKGFRLHVVNAIWGQQGFKFTPQYLDLLAQNYGAGLRILDFIKSPDPSRQTINSWVSDQTEGKIKDLLPQGSITDLTRLVLTNAIYFNLAWQSQFQKGATTDGKFVLLDESQVTVPMMHQQKSFGYAHGEDYQVVELPYDGNELSMVILLPKADRFKNFESALSTEQVELY
jgi:serpin B